MSKIREIREAIDTKMDKWEASATAFEAQLQQTEEQALAKLEVYKKKLNEALEKFKSEVANAKGINEEKKKDSGRLRPPACPRVQPDGAGSRVAWSDR